MSQAAKAQEPSMEEILASIRRIIADDDAGKSKAAEPKPVARAPAPPVENTIPAPAFAPETAPPAGDPAEDVLDLTPSMELPQAAAGFQTITPTQDLVFEEPAAPSAEPDLMAEAEQGMEAPVDMDAMPPVEPPSTLDMARHHFDHDSHDERSILAATTASAVDSAFNTLAQTVLVQNSQTLDGLVREMLRPMLKAWLDDNLPNMVERMVRAEIERVSRGHG
jgi:cell pole-organizing protein PopZ